MSEPTRQEVHDGLVATLHLLERGGGTQCQALTSCGESTRLTDEGDCTELAMRQAAGGMAASIPLCEAFCRANDLAPRTRGTTPSTAGGGPIWNFNDSHTWPDTKAALIRAIDATAPVERRTFDLTRGEIVPPTTSRAGALLTPGSESTRLDPAPHAGS